MLDQTYQKPLLLALAGAVALTAALYTYQQYANQPTGTSLHRSNAIRRPRRRDNWRSGYQPILDYDPIDEAIKHLNHRNEMRQGYGQYNNPWFFPTLEPVDLTLIPCNLVSIYGFLVECCGQTLSDMQQECLLFHIHAMFVQNFVKEEFPEGFVFAEDASILARALENLGVKPQIVYVVAKAFDQAQVAFKTKYNPLSVPEHSPRVNPTETDGAVETIDLAARDVLQALADANDHSNDENSDNDSDSDISFGNHEEDPGGSQNMLDLLYHIAGEQARREGYIHRGVECNSCGVHPIAGIRYHCANCFDFDLCESCEASSSHVKSHVFYKIRIPAPSRGNVKQVTPKWYPGNPDAFATSLPSSASKPLLEETGMERTEMDALYEQFKCVASHYCTTDPTGLGVAIDRKDFDAYFISSNGDRGSPANLIYDRIFAFYDTNRDGLITFDEYIRGLSRLQDKGRYARLKRIFEGYDLDGDGYVDRKDFLRMLRAYYALSKELSREMINTQGDFGFNEEELREVAQGSQPISAVFGGGNLYGHESRTGQDKQRQSTGDLQLINGSAGVLQNDSDMRGDRARAIGNAALGDRSRAHPFRSFRREAPEDEPVMMVPNYGDYTGSGMEQDEVPEEDVTGPDAPLQTYPWPPLLSPTPDDIVNALGHQVPLEDITDPVDRTRVLYAQSQRLDAAADHVEEATRAHAVEERWRRRQFYLDDEEGMTKPPGYTEPDSSDEEDNPPPAKKHARHGASPRRASMASRSSSKVRFDDSAIDTDYETRSNASSRSIPVNERWGGYELSQAEADIGKDILYQAVQQGFNQLLDALFKDKEDDFMAAQETRNTRRLARKERSEFATILRLDKDHDDPRLAAEIESMRRKNDKEEARHMAIGNTDHLRNPTAMMLAEESLAEEGGGLEESVEFTDGFRDQPPEAVSEAPPTHDVAAEELYRDPTLPQFRPDEAELVTASRSSTKEESRFTPDKSPRDAQDDGPGPAIPTRPRTQTRCAKPPVRTHLFTGNLVEARNLYYLWQKHDLIDAEANRRGGGGKLSFSEFRRKMVPECEVGKALGDKNKEKEDKEPETWESSADMGNLAFVGTWLEMASF
ncbi:EF hand domain protein [Cladophialophora carrionii]|uniref:EF hand domain protein n=1 Tax=Cladophialophora carrionii TaxID=86049 RepID=A0A1C1CE52_9EURO|nr:EF hand domain protein [Cladophialophora carrionii]